MDHRRGNLEQWSISVLTTGKTAQIIDFLIIDDVNAGFNDVKNENNINDVNVVTNANNNYFYWVNVIKYVKNIKDIND